jgi:hypothetical protein
MQLANLRRTRIPEDLQAFTSALSGFGQEAINRACERIETSDIERNEPAFPRLGKLLEECRREASTHHPDGDIHFWTVDDYRMCKAFDTFMHDEEELHHKTQAQVMTTFPGMARKWMAWKKQLDEGTLICPHWCDRCDGIGWVFITDDQGEQAAKRCPDCKK